MDAAALDYPTNWNPSLKGRRVAFSGFQGKQRAPARGMAWQAVRLSHHERQGGGSAIGNAADDPTRQTVLDGWIGARMPRLPD